MGIVVVLKGIRVHIVNLHFALMIAVIMGYAITRNVNVIRDFAERIARKVIASVEMEDFL